MTGFQRVIICAIMATGAVYADDMTWASAGNNVWSDFYISPYTAVDNTTGQTVTIFCIDYNHDIAPPSQWQANSVAFSSANLGQYQFGGNYPGVLPANSTSASSFAFQSQTTTSNASTVTADLSTSGSLDRYLELNWLVTQMETALSNGSSGNMSTAAMNAALDIYQVADWLVFADSGPSQFAAGMSHIADLESRIAATGGNYAYDSTLGLWSASASGYSFQYAVDSALRAAQDAVVNQGWQPTLAFNVVTGDATWAARNNGGVPVQEFLSLSPVPEPSAVILLFTAIGLAGFAARRTAKKRAMQVA